MCDVSQLSDDPLPPPDHIITSPAKQQQEETTTNKGYEHLLTALKTVAAAVPNMKKTVRQVGFHLQSNEQCLPLKSGYLNLVLKYV